MATTVTFNGASYSVPAYGDTGWAQGPGNLSAYLIAISSGSLQTTGGNFTLSAPVNFGATYGILSAYLSSVTASPATVGVLRLALSDSICWGPSNLPLAVSSSRLTFNGVQLLVAGDLPSTVVEYREVYVAGTALNNYTGSLTVINMVGSYLTNGVNLQVFVNGLCQDVTLDYVETSITSLTFNNPLNQGDRISLRWVTY